MTGMVKDVAELEEFYKNLGIEYRFSCYYEKNAEGMALHMTQDVKSVHTLFYLF